MNEKHSNNKNQKQAVKNCQMDEKHSNNENQKKAVKKVKWMKNIQIIKIRRKQ